MKKHIKLDIQRFSHTNSTTNYEFPIFVGTDKPGWLTDVNGFATAADTAIKAAKDKADDAYTLAGTAEGKADLAQQDATTALNQAGSANTNIGTMANLNTTEKSSLVGAINEVNNRVNFVNFKRFTTDDYEVTNAVMGGHNLNIATNADGSLCKVYGATGFYVNATQTQPGKLVIKNTGLTVASEFTVVAQGIYTIGDTAIREVGRLDLVFKTNGNLEINLPTMETGKNYGVVLHPSIIQVKSFGDQPV